MLHFLSVPFQAYVNVVKYTEWMRYLNIEFIEITQIVKALLPIALDYQKKCYSVYRIHASENEWTEYDTPDQSLSKITFYTALHQ
jgi:hypothetical protein